VSVRRLALLVWLTGCSAAAAIPIHTPQEADPPRLVVLVVVDQMRDDYLSRFAPMFDGGFSRLLEHGTSFQKAYHDHAFTQTAPGHATLSTGVFPSRHGVVDNTWYDRGQDRAIYAVEDLSSPILGFPEDSGRSPVNLMRPTVGDWLKAASPQSKVFSVSTKDRAAVLMGGAKPDGAYWYHAGTGRYVTSQYYRDAMPHYVTEFNAEHLADKYILAGWYPSLPEDAYGLSREDNFAAEDDSVDAAFPHLFDVAIPDTTLYPDSVPHPERRHYSRLRVTPFADRLTFALAREIVRAESLGADDVPDLLLVSASAGDFIGHEFGPMSWEIQDEYHQLDEMLEEFFAFLDEQVGPEEYAVALTSDHGVAWLVEEARRHGKDAMRIGTTEIQGPLVRGLQVALFTERIYGQPALSNMFPYGLTVTFSGSPDTLTTEQLRAVRRIVADSLRTAPVLADVFTYDELHEGIGADRPFFEAFQRSFYPDRAADLILLLKENYTTPRVLRANHGSPYEYDAHVPLIFMGPGIPHSKVDRRVSSVDVAPTLAALLGIDPPGDLDGKVLKEVAGSK
jgi:predicted AlkP superfamily pyrophosphatase or phosphodiesterase